ncbi:Aspartic peptidase domain containing protein [Tylopilus felleus]
MFTTFSLILLSTSTYVNALPAALPVENFTFPLIRLEGTGAYLEGAVNASRARARFLKSRTPVGPSSMTVLSSGAQLVVEVGVGNPVAYQHLLVDTGHDFCGISSRRYTETDTSKSTGQEVTTKYGNGDISLKGTEYLDEVILAPGLVIPHQSIGSVSSSSRFNHLNVHGILGLAPVGLTKGLLRPNTNELIPTVMNNLKLQGLKEVFSVYIPPITGPERLSELTYGGIDISLYQGDLMYFPLTTTSPASQYWGLDLSSCMYGSRTIIQTTIAGILDTGDPMILIPDNFFQLYMDEIPGAVLNKKAGLMKIPRSSVAQMQPLHFRFGDHDFTLDVDSQLVPQEIITASGGNTRNYYGTVRPMGRVTKHGFDFILGRPFMEKYYTVFDADRQRIGFAPVYVLVWWDFRNLNLSITGNNYSG